jgi:tetratricopeptide (TPR) repeat protein/predicted Ser/Thr protein kinase
LFNWNLQPGDEIHGLRIVREVGQGAYGRVYLARDLGIDREVALKVIRAPAGSRERRRAQREARIVGRLKSSHIVTIHRVVEDDEHEAWLLILEYVPGGSLDDLLRGDQRVAVPRALELLRGIMLGLDAAHRAGVVHGDVKPGNVLLESDGSVKLADFGMSWMVDDASISNTSAEGFGGTPAYMAPEVIMGERGRGYSDVWSAGVMFYRLLAGQLPFPADSLHELFFNVQNASPPAFTGSMPGSVQALAMSLLEKNPIARPQNAEAVLQRLDELHGKPLPASIELIEEVEEIRQRPPTPRLLGRDSEQQRLRARLPILLDGKGGTLLIGGEAGIGKTALVREFADHARTQDVAVLEIVGTPLEGVLRPLVRGTRDSLNRAEGRMLDVVLTRLAREARESLLGHATQTQSGGSAAETLQQLAWGTEQFLREYGEATPLVLVIENLHAVEPEELRMLRELVMRLQNARILIVLTYRTHDVHASVTQSASVATYRDLTTIPDIEILELGALAPEAVLALLNSRFPGTFVAPELAHQVVATAEGNPLFAREILHHLEEIGAIRQEGSSLRATQDSVEIELPGRFQELVERRLAGLEEEPRTLLDAAAVDGRIFDGTSVAAMLDRPLLSVLRDLQRLYRERHLIEPVNERYRFTSKLIHSVIYDQIAPALRRAMHGALAEYLETDDLAPEAERLGLHWERAGNPERARPYLLAAARDAAQRQLHRKALDLAARSGLVAGAVDESDAAAHPETLLELGRTFVAMNRFSEASGVFAALEAGAADERVRLLAALEENFLRNRVEGPDSVDVRVLERAEELTSDPIVMGMALRLRATLAMSADHMADAAELADRAADVFRGANQVFELGQALMKRATIAARDGLPEEAERIYDEAASIFEDLGREANARVCDVNRALSRIQRGQLEDNSALLERAFRTFQLGGYVPQAVQTGCHLANLQYALGDLTAAFATLAEAREIVGEVEDKGAGFELHATQAVLLLAQGRVSTAHQHWQASCDAAQGMESAQHEVGIACFEAQWRAVTGDDQSGPVAQRAIESSRLSDAARTRAYPGWELVDCVPFGLSASVFPDDETDSSLALLYDCARAFEDEAAPPDRLERAVAAFDADPPPWRRAALKLWRDAVEAEAKRRRGEDTAATLTSALGAAQSLGNVWWEAYFLRRLVQLGSTADYASELDRLVFQIADSCDDPSQKRRIVQHWSIS